MNRLRSRSEGLSLEELAMHRKLSEVVREAFCADSMDGILSRMMRSALEASQPRS